MATKSTNTQGNPYHDEATGEFTSANGGGAKEGEAKKEAQPDLTNQPNLSNSTIKQFRFKLKGNVEDIKHKLNLRTQVSSIPFLASAYDIEEHIEEFLPDEIISKVDSYFGQFKIPYKYFNKRTDPNERCGVNIFAACIGKKRWSNNYLRLVDYQEFNRILREEHGCKQLFRGLRGSDTEFETIANSYSSKENEMIYGSVGGTAYGIAVYASNSRWEAEGYASSSRHVMNLVLNTNARTMSYRQICRIRDDLNNRKSSIVAKVEKKFLDYGIEPSRARQMAASFGITIGDEGFVAMLCGVEWYQSGSYHMIENLGSMYRLLK